MVYFKRGEEMRNDVINMSRGRDKEKNLSPRKELNLAGPAHHESFVAQWLEHPTGVWKVIGSIPVGDSNVFLVPCS